MVVESPGPQTQVGVASSTASRKQNVYILDSLRYVFDRSVRNVGYDPDASLKADHEMELTMGAAISKYLWENDKQPEFFTDFLALP